MSAAHRKLGKNNNKVNAEKWKSDMKNKCLKSLKKKRKQKLQNLAAEDIGELVRKELLAEEEQNRSNILSEAERLEFMNNLEEYLYQEQIENQFNMWDDETLSATQEDKSVACVICKRNKIEQSSNNLSCSCGFNLPFQPMINSLEDFKNIVMTAVENHSMDCNGSADFSFSQSNSGQYVLSYSCPECLRIDIIGRRTL